MKVPHHVPFSMVTSTMKLHLNLVKLCKYLIVLLIITDFNHISVQSENPPSSHYLMPAPTVRVFLFSFERGPLLTVTEQANIDVILTKAPGYFEAYNMECNATFPVQWVYTGEGAPLATADVARSFRDFFDPSTYMYQASLIMFNLHEQNSGRYVCRGIESQYQKISSFLHIYIPGDDILMSTIEKTVTVAPYKDQITIPCGVSDPTSPVNLYKGNYKGAFKRMETNSSIVFNPRRGFRLQKNALQDPFGKYLCVSPVSKKRVRVEVVPKDGKLGVRPKREVYENNEVFGHSGALEYSYDARYHRMLCCSSSGIAPKLHFAGCTSIVDCEIKSACFRENKCEAREGFLDHNGYYNNYIGLDPSGCTGHTLRSDPNGDFGLFLCTDSTNAATLYQPYALNRGNLFMSFDVAPPAEKVMTLHRATNEELFVGSETEFRCNVSRFFFATGLRWAFERMDGDLEFLEDNEVVRDAYFVNNHRRHTTLRIPHASIKSVVCVAPVWNSATEWRILNVPIRVSQVFHPPPQLSNQYSVEESVAKSQYTSPVKSSSPHKVVYKAIESSSIENKKKIIHRLQPIHTSIHNKVFSSRTLDSAPPSSSPAPTPVSTPRSGRQPLPQALAQTQAFTEQPSSSFSVENSTPHLKHIYSLKQQLALYNSQTSPIPPRDSSVYLNSQEAAYGSYNNHHAKSNSIRSGEKNIENRPISISHQYFYRTINTKRDVEPTDTELLSSTDDVALHAAPDNAAVTFDIADLV